ncbi:putative xyloglucan endotransglucosylase/hydrolase protein 26 [Bidens hawaiensis]|uniref:putative xyloglucan endotransglucosylase/hydrolase protein 26 n=1 Tax=Bidens hawaiensis TaxID=980011 RepID=UPI00404AEF57
MVNANFPKSMYFNWGAHHSSILGNGDDLRLVLDQTSGSGIQSKRTFLFGSIEMLIKLVPGNSAGTVTAYYLSSTGAKHDEIDFEFLGNSTGEPYTVHTNIFTQGQDGMLIVCLFESSETIRVKGLHTLTNKGCESTPVCGMLTTGQQVLGLIWFVYGSWVSTLSGQRRLMEWVNNNMHVLILMELLRLSDLCGSQTGVVRVCSLGPEPTTRGGLVKIDWTSAPFEAYYRRFRARACKWNGPVSISQYAIPSRANWWTSPVYQQLSFRQQGQMKWVRDNYMIYNYCTDFKRFNGQMAPECSKPQY